MFREHVRAEKDTAVVITEDPEDGGFVGRCDDLHANSQGDTFGEAVENTKEAVLAAEELGSPADSNMLIIKRS